MISYSGARMIFGVWYISSPIVAGYLCGTFIRPFWLAILMGLLVSGVLTAVLGLGEKWILRHWGPSEG